MQQTPQQAFTKLLGLPLTKTTRRELVQYFHFGHTHYTTPQGLILDVGKLTLAVNCPWQLQQPDGNSIKHSDVYIRKREAGLPTPVWDWKEPGSSFLDQCLTELTKTSAPLMVARVEELENHGFILSYTDGSILTVAPDPTKPDAEYWKLFSNTDDFTYGAGAETQV